MPEYLQPGVYVEEIGTGARPIEGVPTTTDPALLRNLVEAIRQAGGAAVPGWVDADASDPGVTLVELFAWLAEDLLYRSDKVPDRGREAALRAIAALGAWAERCPGGSEPIRRPNFFAGQLLDAATLQGEQDYHRAKLRRHNLALLGSGIVAGLGVRIDADSDPGSARVVVEPGYALDPRGEEITLPCAAALALPADADVACVGVRFWEHPCAATAALAPGPVGTSWTEEACVVSVAPAFGPGVVALARLVRSTGTWAVDPGFAPPRARTGGC